MSKRRQRGVYVVFVTTLLGSALVNSGCESSAGGPEPTTMEEWSTAGGLRFGDLDDPDYSFGVMGAIAVASDGSMFTAHPREGEIREWTVDGKPAGKLGGRGQGPGEFTGLGDIGLSGDTLWAMDRRTQRVTYFDPEGKVARTVPLTVDTRGQTSDPTLGNPRPSDPLPDGTFYGQQSGILPQMAGRDTTFILHLHLDARSRVLDTVLAQPILRRDRMAVQPAPGSRRWLYGSQPFAGSPLTSFEPGQQAVVVVDRRTHQGQGLASFSVTKVSMTGDTIFRREIPYVPEPVDQETVDRVVDADVRQWLAQQRPDGDLDQSRLEELARGALYVPTYYPPVSFVVMGRDGTIWLRDERPTSAEIGWTVLDSDGRPLARIRLSTIFQMKVADRDAVWGLTSDRAGVSYVIRYDLRHAPAPADGTAAGAGDSDGESP